jgi:hypothetical protein
VKRFGERSRAEYEAALPEQAQKLGELDRRRGVFLSVADLKASSGRSEPASSAVVCSPLAPQA